MSEWEQTRSEGGLVYWRRQLPDGSWLAVSKSRDAEPRWAWAHYGPQVGVVNAGAGGFALSRSARDAADAYQTVARRGSS